MDDSTLTTVQTLGLILGTLLYSPKISSILFESALNFTRVNESFPYLGGADERK